jgi:parvulin-like peptidyl-prolyl isomerase
MTKKLHLLRIITLLLFLLPAGWPAPLAASWFSHPDRLVVIDDKAYSVSDFKNWWQNWKGAKTPVPETPDPYIDWLLMLRDAKLMQLDDNPEYRHKIEVFLKFRTLMLLKQEEIDSRLTPPSEKELRKLYDRDYLPRLQLEIIELPTRAAVDKVEAARKQGLDGKASAKAAGLKPAPAWKRAMVRPVTVKGPLEKVYAVPRKAGDRFTLPYGKKFLLLEVVAVHPGSADDFAGLRNRLKEKLLRRQSEELNRALIQRLKAKYQPVIHRDRLEKLTPDSDAATRDAVIIEIGELKITGRQILPYLAREKSFRRRLRGQYDKHSDAELKERIVNNIVTQTLIGREALARHYEEKSPFREVYRFYCDNRMVAAWKKTVLEPRIKISDEDIAAEYRRLADHFRQPDEVDIAWVRTSDKKLARRLQAELDQGEDFFKVMTPRFGRGIETGRQPVNRLPAYIRKAVAKLADGQVSAPVERGDEIVFIKLVRRYPGQPRPLKEVAGELRKMLYRKRYRETEKALLAQLRKGSEIEVDEGAWKDLRRELLAAAKTAEPASQTRAKGETRP